jgi:ATP-binding cassette subfamily B protein
MVEERRLYAAGSIFVGLGIFTALAYPQAVRLMIDGGIQSAQAERINVLALAMLVLLALEATATYFRDYFFKTASERVVARLRRLAFDHLLRQDISFYDRSDTGDLTTRLWSEISGLQRLLGEKLADALRVGLWAVGGTILLFYTSAPLTLLILLAVPPMVVASSILGGRIKRESGDAQEAFAAAGATAQEAIAGIRTVRAFSQEARESERYGGQIAAAVARTRPKSRAEALLASMAFLAGEGAALLALWAGGHLILRGTLTSGALISFILYAFLVARGFRSASAFWTDAMRVLGATAWVFELLSRRAPEEPIGARLERVEGAVSFERIRFAYPSRPAIEALSDVSVRIAPGETVAFVGRSGSGKSTLVSLLLRFYEPTGGRILIDGHDIRELDVSWLRDQIGVVLQEPVLFSRPIAENIRFGRPAATEADVARAATLAGASGFIARIPGTSAATIGDRGVQLSGGQRQRLAIARALVRSAKILVLDEATSALDGESESLVQAALRALDCRPTTLIVAHRLSTVVGVDRVVVLDQGRVLAEGPHEALLQTSSIYRQLVETQLVAL